MKSNCKIILVLFLTSFCYFKCNSFSDYLHKNMVNAREILKDLASSVNIGLKTLGETIKFLDKFVDSTLEEDCIYECPRRDEVPVDNPNHVHHVNGCGSMGLYLGEEVLPRPEMVKCCNLHDICYDTCGADKEECDKKFKHCLYNFCDENKPHINKVRHRMCQGGAKILYTATMALGCSSFKDAQSRSCICKPDTSSNTKSQFRHSQEEL